MPSTDSLRKAVEGYSVVSFDIFDTLLKRAVEQPSDVFALVEHNASDAFGHELAGFSQKRIAADRKARETNGGEVTLDDIYVALSPEAEFGVSRKDLAAFELEVERAVLVANPELIGFYNELVEREDVEVVIISDTYFARDFISDVMNSLGMSGWDRLYLSCECGVSKRDGGLFDMALKDLGASASEVIHIGDSPIEDENQPKSRGIAALRVPTYFNRLSYLDANTGCSDVEQSTVKAYLNVSEDGCANGYERFGYEVLGPLLYGFSVWMRDQLVAQGIDRVYFFSRDGFIMKAAFEALYEQTDIETSYFYVSRQSLRTALLWKNYSIDTVADVVQDDRFMSIRMLLENLGLEADEVCPVLGRYGLSLDDAIERVKIGSDSRVAGLLTELESDIIDHSREQFAILRDYVAQEGMSGRFAVVDIGWRGSIQLLLEDALAEMGIECDVDGFYVGLRDNRGAIKRHGYLFEPGKNAERGTRQSGYLGLTELMFFGAEGSTKGYVRAGDAVKALLFDYEYEELPGQSDAIRDVQHGALEFVSRFAASSLSSFAKPDEAFILDALETVGLHPSRTVLDAFAHLMFFDGVMRPLVQMDGLASYVAHPKQFVMDFDKCRWKAAFLQEALKIPGLQGLAVKMLYSFKGSES